MALLAISSSYIQPPCLLIRGNIPCFASSLLWNPKRLQVTADVLSTTSRPGLASCLHVLHTYLHCRLAPLITPFHWHTHIPFTSAFCHTGVQTGGQAFISFLARFFAASFHRKSLRHRDVSGRDSGRWSSHDLFTTTRAGLHLVMQC